MTSFKSTSASPTQQPNGVCLFTVPEWSGYDWLWHGFSTYRGGVSRVYLSDESKDQSDPGQLNLGYTASDEVENVRENRLRWTEAVTGSRDIPLRTIRQVHSCTSVTASVAVGDTIPEADGIMTQEPGALLGVMTADCIPVLVADPVKRAVAAFHAGWRGTAARIVELGVGRMTMEFGSHPAQLLAAIGPGIGACCYTVGVEVQARFSADFRYGAELFARDADAVRLDLTEANRRQLLDAGLSERSIATVGGCTSCQPDRFYSHRASGGHAGRMMASIGIRG